MKYRERIELLCCKDLVAVIMNCNVQFKSSLTIGTAETTAETQSTQYEKEAVTSDFKIKFQSKGMNVSN